MMKLIHGARAFVVTVKAKVIELKRGIPSMNYCRLFFTELVRFLL